MPVDELEAPDLIQQLRETCHDMRQPVASVFALAAAALAQPDLAGSVREPLEQIVGQVQWLSSMIDEFLHDTEQEDADGIGRTDLDETEGMASRPDVVPLGNEIIAAGRLIWPCDVTVHTQAAPLRWTLPPYCSAASSAVCSATRHGRQGCQASSPFRSVGVQGW